MARRRADTRDRRIVEFYSFRGGWERVRRRIRLDEPTAEGLRAEGFTMVRVRVSPWQSREVSLLRFLQADGSDPE